MARVPGLRVIAGRLRGRRLVPPRWPGLRPTSDRLRETLFNVVGAECAGARVLDLCAGTGAVGIEAISRGAAHVTFVDEDARACDLIAANLASCGLGEGYTIVRASIEQVGTRPGGTYEVVFLDPPYAAPALERWTALAADRVSPAGVLVVEHDRRRELPAASGPLERVRVLRSGDSALSFYRRPAARAGGGGDRDVP
jgi:16S rRNA (guanine(966)-N(2))-methyltransferase RsmD